VRAEQLDAAPHLLNFRNGSFDLRAHSFREHRREDFLTQCVSADFDPGARCPQFEGFMDSLFPDREVRSFAQRLMGLVVSGEHREQVVAFLWGEGRNGKSTFLNVMHDALGPYAKTAARGLLKATRGADTTKDYGVADLRSARLVSSVEAGAGSSWDDETLKALSGGDSLSARWPYGRPFQFRPTFTLFVAANDRPRVRDQSEGFWRRMLLIPFEAKFEGRTAIKDMRDRLRAESSGILNYMLAGLRAYESGGLNPPERVRAATNEYREESNPFGQFLSERCEPAPEASVLANVLWSAWRVWAADTGVYAGTQTTFGRAVSALGVERSKSHGTIRYTGLRLKSLDVRAAREGA